MVLALPRLLATAWASAAASRPAGSARGFGDGDVLGVLARRARRSSPSSSRCSASATCWSGWSGAPPSGCGGAPRAGRSGAGSPALLAAALVAGLAWAWWPDGDTLPAGAGLGGRHGPRRRARREQQPRSARGSQGAATTIWPDDAGPLPTADHPALAMVLVPARGERGQRGTPATRRRRGARRPGCSRSTGRCRPGRGTTRRSRSTPRTARSSTTSPSPSSGPTATTRAQPQRGLRAGQLPGLPHRRGRVPGRAAGRLGRRRRAAEPRPPRSTTPASSA